MSFEKELEKHQDKKTDVDAAYQFYNTYKDYTDRKVTDVSSWLSKYWEQIISLIIAFFLIGIQQFAEPQFDPYFFIRPKFWYEFIPYVMAIWIIIVSTLTSNMKWLEEASANYTKTMDSIQRHVDDDKKTPYIYEGAKLVDRERKIIAWRSKISRQIDKKRHKAGIPTFAALKAFMAGDDKVFDSKIKTPKNDQIMRLRASFEELFSYLEEDYIDTNIDSIKIDYNRVTETLLVSGVYPSDARHAESNFKENTSSVIFDEFGSGFIISSIFSAVLLALDLATKGAELSTWVVFIFKAFMLYTYFFRASARSPMIFQKTRLKAAQERDSMLETIKRRILSPKQ